MAFPNAYIEVDEPPRRLLQRALAVVGAVCTAYFGLTILALSLFDRDYSPISQVASDYGVGRYALEMNVGFLVGGVGLVAFALAYGRERGGGRSRTASGLLLVAGLVLVMESHFTTDLEGTVTTLHGIIHNLGGLVFFVAMPVGVLLTRRRSSRQFIATLAAFAAGFLLLAAGAGAAGLAERLVLLVAFTSVILSAAELYRAGGP